jgi:putative phage-type endonuclease
MEQRTDEWFEARLGKATASRFKDIMTTVKYGEAAAVRNYRAQLVAERLTGSKEETWTSPAMQWGIDYEPLARLRYELASSSEVEECGFFPHPELQAGASPDGLIGEDGLLEIKCPNTATHIDSLKAQDVPKLYYWQVMGQLWVTGRKWCDFVSFDPRMPANAQLFIKRVVRDEAAITDLEEAIRNFLMDVDREEQFIKQYTGKGGLVTVTKVSAKT